MSVQEQIADLVKSALDEAHQQGLLPEAAVDDVPIERPQNVENGDFASSLPLRLARPMRKNPVEIAETLAALIPTDGAFERIWAAKPGFINVALKGSWLAEQVETVLEAGDAFGNVAVGQGSRVQVEFVSINPTGPLHVGHIRGAVLGSALANVLETAGYDVQREYYLNDAGTQMDRFNESLYVRYLQLFGREAEVPEDGYKGDYMIDFAQEIRDKEGERFLDMPKDEAVKEIGEIGLAKVIALIRDDLELVRVRFDRWFSERSLFENGQYDTAMKLLDDAGYLTERDDATWFASTALGDEEDKVLVRSTGEPAYFATDVAYHYNKFFERKFDRVIDILGADHQGHVPFMRAVAGALGVSQDRLSIILNQIVSMRRGDVSVRLSKRSGELITMRDLVEEVGADACRYLFLSRSADSQMEFDLEVAKDQSPDNPIYYSQYAHARISGVLRLAEERAIDYSDGDVSLLVHEAELALIRKMLLLPELVEQMAASLEPHHLPHYANEVAAAFHRFYDQCRVVSSVPEDAEITKARLKLCLAAQLVLARCLGLMLMDAPDRM